MPKNELISVIITVFLAVVIVDSLSEAFPTFTIYGWGLISAFVAGAGWYFRNKYFKDE